MQRRITQTLGPLCVTLVLLLSAGCDLSTNVDYDPDADFSAIKTYAWTETRHPEISDLAHRRIVGAVNMQLEAKGLRMVESEPDVTVTYHGDDREKVEVDTAFYGYRYGPRWRWHGGVPVTASQVRTYKEGTLIIDIYNTAEKILIWRGTVTGTISENPQENAKKIDKGVEKVFEKYPPEEKK
jgi:hypothetical protein